MVAICYNLAMSRTVYLIRHCNSEGNRHNELSFGPKGSKLNDEGIRQAKQLRKKMQDIDLDVESEPAASSEMRRAYSTAFHAGFKTINLYALLNETSSDLSPGELDAILERKAAPPSAIAAAQNLLENPPKEKVWVTHGQLIAGIAHVLGIPVSDLFIPDMGTVTKLELP